MGQVRRVFAILMVLFLAAFGYMNGLGAEDQSAPSMTENLDLDQLRPHISEELTPTGEEPTLYAAEALLMDGDTGRVLYEKEGYTRHAMASTTKIMTAIYVIENCSLDDVAVVSKYASQQPKVRLGVTEGEQYQVRDLLYALMLESYNDCAVVLAEHVSGTVEAFCKEMTQKAKELGCEDTSFQTPNGLDGEQHYTTPYDLAKITKYALENETFSDIVRTREYHFSEWQGKRQVSVYNKDGFLTRHEGAIGVKTGYTSKAGYCFVGAIKHRGYYLISVVLGSGWPPHKTYKWADTMALMAYGEKNYKNCRLTAENVSIGTIPVEHGKEQQVSICLEEGREMLLSAKDQVETKLLLYEQPQAPLPKESRIGTLAVYVNGQCYEVLELKTKEEIEKEGMDAVLMRIVQKYSLGGQFDGT